ncbi:Holliday junction resolvase RuvX [Mycoplasmatota bacterium]|nr:Holliday junction resolvase RuvX [Mycoplasmatota bacterium]
MKTYLGIDLGSKTIGLSISSSGIIAESYDTLYFSSNKYDEAVEKIINVVKLEHINVIVLGYPKHMNNDIGIRGKISEDVKLKIEEKFDGEVVLWDERLSTKSALNAMILGNQSRKKQKKKKDEMAAVVILQNYLDYKGA